MPKALQHFICQYLGVVCAALAPVVLVTFLSVPLSLGGHPGEIHAAAATVDRHLS